MRFREGAIVVLVYLLGSASAFADSHFFDLCRRALRLSNPISAVNVDLYRTIPSEPNVIDAVVVVVKKNGQFLLGYRGVAPMRGLWGQLGGKISVGETIAQTAIREVREESGIELKELKYLFMTRAFLSENGKSYRIFVVEATSFEGEAHVTEPEKTPMVGWFAASLIPETLTSATREYFERLKVVGQKCH